MSNQWPANNKIIVAANTPIKARQIGKPIKILRPMGMTHLTTLVLRYPISGWTIHAAECAYHGCLGFLCTINASEISSDLYGAGWLPESVGVIATSIHTAERPILRLSRTLSGEPTPTGYYYCGMPPRRQDRIQFDVENVGVVCSYQLYMPMYKDIFPEMFASLGDGSEHAFSQAVHRTLRQNYHINVR